MDNARPTSHEIAYSAGLFEGEGTVVYVKEKNYIYVRIKMTDADVIERMFKILGGRLGKPVKPGQPHHKPQFEWFMGGRDEVIELFSMWKPWLGERRIAQFEEKIALSQPRRKPAQLHCVSDPTIPTQRGYHAHLRMGEEPCQPCREAYNLYMEQYRRSKGMPERTARSEEERVLRRRALRKSRYATDLEFRQATLERNRIARERRRNHDST